MCYVIDGYLCVMYWTDTCVLCNGRILVCYVLDGYLCVM